MTTEQQPLDLARTAVLIMDFQNDIVNNVAQDSAAVVEKAAQVLSAARQSGVPVFHVIHRGGRFESLRPARRYIRVFCLPLGSGSYPRQRRGHSPQPALI